jgi:predicted nucleic-acid-binding Zn-ribbon protein
MLPLAVLLRRSFAWLRTGPGNETHPPGEKFPPIIPKWSSDFVKSASLRKIGYNGAYSPNQLFNREDHSTMRNGQCSQCGGPNVFQSTHADGLQRGLLADAGSLRINIIEAKRFIDDVTSVLITCYICADCAYAELYAADRSELARLANATNWRRVQPAG